MNMLIYDYGRPIRICIYRTARGWGGFLERDWCWFLPEYVTPALAIGEAHRVLSQHHTSI